MEIKKSNHMPVCVRYGAHQLSIVYDCDLWFVYGIKVVYQQPKSMGTLLIFITFHLLYLIFDISFEIFFVSCPFDSNMMLSLYRCQIHTIFMLCLLSHSSNHWSIIYQISLLTVRIAIFPSKRKYWKRRLSNPRLHIWLIMIIVSFI